MTDQSTLNTCGCGDQPEKEPAIVNRAGLDELAYRIADYGTFRQRMTAHIGRLNLFGLDQKMITAAEQYGLDQTAVDQINVAINLLVEGAKADFAAAKAQFLLDIQALDSVLLQHPGFAAPLERLLNILGRQPLTTRSEDDFSIGLLDSWAVVGDVLTFYQERVANEGYLRTASERLSILELARAIGYELNPGVAAETYLAFTVDESETTPDEIDIPLGTQVQSLPQKQGELPQTFETVDPFVARSGWNALRPRLKKRQVIQQETTDYIFVGTRTGARVGDRLLVLGQEKKDDVTSDKWDVRRVLAVASDAVLNQTIITVDDGLTQVTFPDDPEIHLFQEKGSVFGHNAADWPSLSNQIKADYLGLDKTGDLLPEHKLEWPNYNIFAPNTGILQDGEEIEWPVNVSARMVADAAVEAAKVQSGLMTRSAMAAAPDVAMRAIGVVETVVREFAGATLSGIALPDPADLQSPLYKIVENIRQVISKITLSPPVVDSDLLDFSEFSLGEIDFSDFGDNDQNPFGKIQDKINSALESIRTLPVTLSMPGVGDNFSEIENALNELWELNPAVRMLGGMSKMVGETSRELKRAMRAARRSADEAIGAGTASVMATALEAIIEGAMNGIPLAQPQDIQNVVRYVTKVVRYAAELPTLDQLDRFLQKAEEENITLLQIPDDVLAVVNPLFNNAGEPIIAIPNAFQDTPQKFLRALNHAYVAGLPADMRDIGNEENFNKQAFYTVIGSMLGGAAGATALFASGGVGVAALAGGGLIAAGPLAGVTFAGVAAGVMPLLMAAPGIAQGTDQMYVAVNQAVDEVMARRGTSETVAKTRGFFEWFDNKVDLDKTYDKIVPDSWAYFSMPLAGQSDLFYIYNVEESSRAEFMITGKVSRLQLNIDGLSALEEEVRDLTIYAATKPLELAEIPVTDLVSGTEITLETLPPPFQASQKAIVAGLAAETALPAAEVVTIKRYERGQSRGRLILENDLLNDYVVESVTIWGNAVRATHGETVRSEILGHGSGAIAHQKFALRKPPLTYVAAPTVTGSASTLTVAVDDVAWEQRRSLYDLAPTAKAYTVRIDNEGEVIVTFGDGQMGARLPTGTENVSATYRSGIGLEGEVAAGTLSLLKTKPHGVKSVVNPAAAEGAEDPESLDDARQNAPMTVRTLDRIVSLRDYEDFAATFAGIGKAQAVMVWDGSRELVHLTVADPTGETVLPDKIDLLLSAMEQIRDRRQQVVVESFNPKSFSLAAGVVIDPAYSWEVIEAQIQATLIEAFSFAKRAFGQPVSAAEILALIHQTAGVVAVDLDELYLDDGMAHSLRTVLPAGIARFNRHASGTTVAEKIESAGLLTINPNGINLQEKAA